MTEAITTEPGAPGILYLCATPIGNLEDMTYRAVRILGEAGLIAAEDTRHTRKLLAHYDIHTPLTSYHEHNKFTKGPELVEYLQGGGTLVCVSDAGLPGIADPGSHLAMLAIGAGVRVVPLPGANAALSALICSGLDTTRFSFLGFLPKTEKKRREILADIRFRQETLLFYEAPHRLRTFLKELTAAFGGARQVVFARELTKKFEEFYRTTLAEACGWYAEHEPRGEFVVVVEGSPEGMKEAKPAETRSSAELVAALMEEDGLDRKAAMREAAKQLGMSRRDVYQSLLETE